MKDYKEYIERYFEGMLSEDEELELKLFLTSEEGQGPEYDEARAVMGFFSTGCSVYEPASVRKPDHVRRIVAVAVSLVLLVTLGVNIYNSNNVCVKMSGGDRITDKEVVMNDVDNILADLMNEGTDVESQLNDLFGR